MTDMEIVGYILLVLYIGWRLGRCYEGYVRDVDDVEERCTRLERIYK